jgi:glycosyltransferase involved in cell wall biosynthesis
VGRAFCKTKDVAVLPSGPRMSLVPVALTTRLQRLLWEQLVLPSLLRRLRIDVLHSPHFTAPIVTGSSRRVVTVHDLAADRHPESHSFVKRWYFRSMIRAARRADRTVTLAESIRDDLITRHGVPAGRIDVVPHGVDDAFRPLGENVPAERTLEEYGLTHVLEAMACGTPVIISDRQAVTEVADDAALRFEATSAEALADVLAATLLDDGLAGSLRASARARARAFTWPRTAELTRDAYERAISVPGTNGG